MGASLLGHFYAETKRVQIDSSGQPATRVWETVAGKWKPVLCRGLAMQPNLPPVLGCVDPRDRQAQCFRRPALGAGFNENASLVLVAVLARRAELMK